MVSRIQVENALCTQRGHVSERCVLLNLYRILRVVSDHDFEVLGIHEC
jgi:hypothetical protein